MPELKFIGSHVNSDLHTKLEAIATTRRIPLAELIRRVLEQYVRKLEAR